MLKKSSHCAYSLGSTMNQFDCLFISCESRFATNSDLGGVERISVSALRPEYGAKPKHYVKIEDLSDDSTTLDGKLAPPHSMFLVKGWTRVLCIYTVLAFLRDCPQMIEAGARFKDTESESRVSSRAVNQPTRVSIAEDGLVSVQTIEILSSNMGFPALISVAG